MDARHFDSLSRVLSAYDSRRQFLALPATLPVVGGLLGLFDTEEVEGRGRRRRRKKRHKHGRGRRRKQKKTCRAESFARTCAGKCGSIANNCKKLVDCGSCDCSPACRGCFTCQGTVGTPGTCIVDEGAACSGDPCLVDQTCNAQGQCAGGTPKCLGQNCVDGTCTPLTCAEECAGCTWCVEKADGTRACAADLGGTACQQCSSDAECPTTHPDCVARITQVSDGFSFTPCASQFPGPACVRPFTACA